MMATFLSSCEYRRSHGALAASWLSVFVFVFTVFRLLQYMLSNHFAHVTDFMMFRIWKPCCAPPELLIVSPTSFLLSVRCTPSFVSCSCCLYIASSLSWSCIAVALFVFPERMLSAWPLYTTLPAGTRTLTSVTGYWGDPRRPV